MLHDDATRRPVPLLVTGVANARLVAAGRLMVWLAPLVLYGAVAGIRDPGITSLGLERPEVARALSVVGLVVAPVGIAYIVLALLSARRLTAVAYGRRAGGRVYVGSWLGVRVAPWRRLRCSDVVTVDVSTHPETGNVTVRLASGGRSLRLRSFGSLEPGWRRRLEAWLAEAGFALGHGSTARQDAASPG